MKRLPKIMLLTTAGIVVVAGLAGAGYFYYKYQESQKEILGIKTDPNASAKAAQELTKKMVDEVGKLIELPQETPTVATVSDVTKLQNQPLFSKAKNGDVVLIFMGAKKAILYDPTSHKIIEVAPINVASTSAQEATAPVTMQANLALRNGTNTQGLTVKFENQLKNNYPLLQVTSKENAANFGYDKSFIVVLNPVSKEVADKLALDLKINEGVMPADEPKPENADLLLILGLDKAQ